MSKLVSLPSDVTQDQSRYSIQATTPSKVIAVGDEVVSYYNFRHVFGRQAGIGIVGAGGFIGEFILNHVPPQEATVVSCSLSRDALKAQEQAASLGLSTEQIANSPEAVINNSNVDVVVVASDNASHYRIAKAALEKGKHVLCEKPVGISADEARELALLAQHMGVVFSINHFYSQYSLVSTLASIVKTPADRRVLAIDPQHFPDACALGSDVTEIKLGELRAIKGAYLQDWVLAAYRQLQERNAAELDRKDLGIWRLNPDVQGPSCAYGDIGVHVVEVLSRILDSRAVSVEDVRLQKHVGSKSLQLDVRAEVAVVFESGHKAQTIASQVEQGRLNDLTVTLEFEGGVLEWSNQRANVLVYTGEIAGQTLSLTLGRDRSPLKGISAEAELLQGVVQGHDQGHGHAQKRLIQLFLDRVCRINLADRQHSLVGEPSYIPTSGQIGIPEMEIIEQLARTSAT